MYQKTQRATVPWRSCGSGVRTTGIDDEFADQRIVFDEKYAHWGLLWI